MLFDNQKKTAFIKSMLDADEAIVKSKKQQEIQHPMQKPFGSKLF